MKIIREKIPESTIEDFADKHGLTMKVVERSKRDMYDDMRFYAHFECCETKEGKFLCGEHGNGANEECAIQNYGDKISEKLLVFNAMSESRKEIQVPRIIRSPRGEG